MSTIGRALTTWEQFLELPDPEPGSHLELHNGEVVIVPPARPSHIFVQALLVEWLNFTAKGRGRGSQEFPYRPAKNLQFWKADVAYVPNEDWQAMRGSEYPNYAPPLIVEVLSPSDTPEKIVDQYSAAFAAGTLEFWIVDTNSRTVEVLYPGQPKQTYLMGETIRLVALQGAALPIATLFES